MKVFAWGRWVVGVAFVSGCAGSVVTSPPADAGLPADVGFILLVDGATLDDFPGRCDGRTFGPCPVLVTPAGVVVARTFCHESHGVYSCVDRSTRPCGPGFEACTNGFVCNADNFCNPP